MIRTVPSADRAPDRAAQEVRPTQPGRTGADVQAAAAAFAVHLDGALADTIGAAGLARALDVSEALVRKWRDDSQHFPAWALVRAREVAPEFVAALDARASATSPLVSRSVESELRRATTSLGDTAQAIEHALSDGVIEPLEARNIARVAAQGARRFLALRDAADAIAEAQP